ncbi:MAG: TraB/GumN family protein [Rhodospirillaceae bacterium]|nr:TraB/GumN family protein [Rhodospirillaceae bacterium]
MIRLARFLAVILVAGVLGAPARPAAAGEAFTHGLLWKVERAGLRPSYVFGTFHTTDPKVLALPEPVRAAFAAADSVSIELEITADVQAQLQRAGRARRGLTLDRLLAPDLLDAVVRKAAEYGLDREQVVAMKPWAVAQLLFGTPPSEQKRQKAGGPFLDLWLLLEAMRQGKPHYGLESVEEQIAVFNGMPRGVQIGLLRSALQNTAEENAFAHMRALYLARDIGGLEADWNRWLARLEPRDAGVLKARLVDDRNRRMVRRMAVRLAEGNAFICMGALHLPGETGILRLLAAQGYTVTPVY